MDSLYGGKQGQSFVLRGRFTSVQDMVNEFSKGASYTDVWYGEYVIIDTPNKNDADNGRIYQRGLNYDNADTGGAIEVGQVVGPSSGTPYMQLLPRKNLDTIKAAYGGEDTPVAYTRFPLDANEDGKADLNEDGTVATTNVSTSRIGELSFDLDMDKDGSVDYDKSSLVPGYYFDPKTEKETFNDSIKYTWLNVRKDNATEDSWFYVGFQIPYLVQEFETKEISPYDEDGNLVTKDKSVTIDSTNKANNAYHPYYQHLTLGIPKGIKGDTIRNLRVVTLTNNVGKIYSDGSDPSNLTIYTESAIVVNDKTGEVFFDETKTYTDFSDNKQVYVYDFYWYDNVQAPKAYAIYVADYKDVRDITIAEDGTITVTYKNNDTQVLDKCVRWMNSVAINGDNGLMHVEMNNDGHDLQKDYYFHVRWPKQMALDTENGKLTVTYTNDGVTNDTTSPSAPTNVTQELYDIPWITEMSLNKDTGQFVANFNNDKIKDIDEFLDWVKSATLAADGTLTWHHTIGDTKNSEKVQWITSARITSDGKIQIVFNTLDERGENKTIYLQDSTSGKEFHVKTIKDVELATYDSLQSDDVDSLRSDYNDFLRKSKKIKVTYNTTTSADAGSVVNEYEYIGDPINYVEDMVVRPEDMHLLVLFSDPDNRYDGRYSQSSDRTYKDSLGRTWTSYLGTSGLKEGFTTDNDIWWRDFGSIKDTSGIMVGTKVVWSEAIGKDSIIDPTLYPDGTDTSGINTYDTSYIKRWLNKNYPKGLTGSTAGKVIIYVDDHLVSSGGEAKNFFFAYDYDSPYNSELSVEDNATRGWFYIGTVSDAGGGGSVYLGDKDSTVASDKVNSGGVWFRVSTLDYTTSTGAGEKVLKPEGIPRSWFYDYGADNTNPYSGTYR